MTQRLGLVTLVVSVYEAAIAYYTRRLGFELVEDTRLDDSKRWMVVRPRGAGGAGLLLARAADDAQRRAISRQTGGQVFLSLDTDAFARNFTLSLYRQRGVQFVEPLRHKPDGTVAVLADLYGNGLDLIGPAAVKRAGCHAVGR